MTNVKVDRDGDKLILTVDLKQRHGNSTSGKSEIIASTGGNKQVPGLDGAKFGLTVYVK